MSTCEKCNSDMTIIVDVTMIIPGEYESKLSKTSVRDKRVQLYAASWNRARYICSNPSCRYTYGGIPTYIKQLEDRIKELESQL
jgi:hypothetical protein